MIPKSILYCLLLLPAAFAQSPKSSIRGVINGRTALNQGQPTFVNCPVTSINTTDPSVTTFNLAAGATANTFSIGDSTGKYYAAPGQNDVFVAEWSNTPYYWVFKQINGNVYTISDIDPSSKDAKCWIASGGSDPSAFSTVVFDTCPGTIPSAWVVNSLS